jgi:hypothetical protein
MTRDFPHPTVTQRMEDGEKRSETFSLKGLTT